MRKTGQVEKAAQTLLWLAGYAVKNREALNVDVVPLLTRAAELFETVGNLREGRKALERRLSEQRDSTAPGPVIAQSLLEMARISELLGDSTSASRLRETADAALKPVVDTGERGSGAKYREIDVYYATDRARNGGSDLSEFYGNERGELELGVATVTIPKTHTSGVIELPSLIWLEFRADPAKHIVLQSIEPLPQDAFYRRLQAEFTQVPEREAFVFIHGFNVQFDQAARRAAQIAYDMNYVGVPILYSWPSWGVEWGYVADTAVVRLSGRRLSRFLEDLVARSGADTIHLVAHSMGNRALSDALELMALRMGIEQGDALLFGQVLFAAPDVDAGLFKEMLSTIRPIAERLTLYASKEDWALATSRKLHGNAPRAGLGGEFSLTNPAIDSIDMSELGEDMMAHSYFANNSSALADMMTLFWRDTAPQGRCGLFADPERDGALPVWRYHKDVCSDSNVADFLAHIREADVQSMAEVRVVLGRTVTDAGLAKKLEAAVSGIIGE